MRGLLISTAAALALGISPVLAAEGADQAQATDDAFAANAGGAWYESLRDNAVMSGDELDEKFAHVEEDLADAAPRPPYVPIGGEGAAAADAGIDASGDLAADDDADVNVQADADATLDAEPGAQLD
jgi:hypothetical protein